MIHCISESFLLLLFSDGGGEGCKHTQDAENRETKSDRYGRLPRTDGGTGTERWKSNT